MPQYIVIAPGLLISRVNNGIHSYIAATVSVTGHQKLKKLDKLKIVIRENRVMKKYPRWR